MAPLRLIYGTHAREQMEERGVSESEVDGVIQTPDLNLPAQKQGRRLLERTIDGRRIGVVVRYNRQMTSATIVTVWVRPPRAGGA